MDLIVKKEEKIESLEYGDIVCIQWNNSEKSFYLVKEEARGVSLVGLDGISIAVSNAKSLSDMLERLKVSLKNAQYEVYSQKKYTLTLKERSM